MNVLRFLRHFEHSTNITRSCMDFTLQISQSRNVITFTIFGIYINLVIIFRDDWWTLNFPDISFLLNTIPFRIKQRIGPMFSSLPN